MAEVEGVAEEAKEEVEAKEEMEAEETVKVEDEVEVVAEEGADEDEDEDEDEVGKKTTRIQWLPTSSSLKSQGWYCRMEKREPKSLL